MAAKPTAKFKIPDPGFDDECPDVPEGATNWERQEITRAWRNAMRYGRDIMRGVEYDLTHAVADGRPMANDAQKMAQYIAARSELSARIDGVHHRLAMTETTEGADTCTKSGICVRRAREEPT